MSDTKIVIDEDCPQCEFPETYISISTRVYGCTHCTWRSLTSPAEWKRRPPQDV